MFHPVAFCEQDPFCRHVLESRMRSGSLPTSPIFADIRTVFASGALKYLDVEVIYGGFPCNDISYARASEQNGIYGKRSGLFFEIVQLIQYITPKMVFLENSDNMRMTSLCDVVAALADIGYTCTWLIMSASDVGAPHRRRRWFCLAKRVQENPSLDLFAIRTHIAYTVFQSVSSTVPFERKTLFVNDMPTATNDIEHFDAICTEWTVQNRPPFTVTCTDQTEKTLNQYRLMTLGNAVVPPQARRAFDSLHSGAWTAIGSPMSFESFDNLFPRDRFANGCTFFDVATGALMVQKVDVAITKTTCAIYSSLWPTPVNYLAAHQGKVDAYRRFISEGVLTYRDARILLKHKCPYLQQGLTPDVHDVVKNNGHASCISPSYVAVKRTQTRHQLHGTTAPSAKEKAFCDENCEKANELDMENPQHAEWLMNLPTDWTLLDEVAQQRFMLETVCTECASCCFNGDSNETIAADSCMCCECALSAHRPLFPKAQPPHSAFLKCTFNYTREPHKADVQPRTLRKRRFNQV